MLFKEKNQKLLCRPKDLHGAAETGLCSFAADCLCTLASTLCFAWSGIHMLVDEFPEMAAYSGGQIPVADITAVLAVMVLLFALPGCWQLGVYGSNTEKKSCRAAGRRQELWLRR